jgi:hypothetical protein
MKKLIKTIALAMLISFSLPSGVFASDNIIAIENPAATAQKLIHRLEEIKAMDTKSMTRLERKELRREVKAVQKELNRSGGGVYLSVGAVILIIVLIILL